MFENKRYSTLSGVKSCTLRLLIYGEQIFSDGVLPPEDPSARGSGILLLARQGMLPNYIDITLV